MQWTLCEFSNVGQKVFRDVEFGELQPGQVLKQVRGFTCEQAQQMLDRLGVDAYADGFRCVYRWRYPVLVLGWFRFVSSGRRLIRRLRLCAAGPLE